MAQVMDFFGHQERAKTATGRLVVLFILAVICIVALVNLAVVIILGLSRQEAGGLWQPAIYAIVTVITLLVIGLGSLYKIMQLRGGGAYVAEHLGGQRVYPDSARHDERVVLNVVEEMAIASGMPVPPVYVLRNESAINAFAAGNTPRDAVIGVTRGCIEQLSRDELQGVIAHEFSHILNGDMRLNIRLIGVLNGILVIGIIGYVLLRSSLYGGMYAGMGSRRSSRDGKNNGVAVMIALGAALAIIGFAGTFFGNLIKAAVSRQREYLADASAVQFTRNPSGIADALKRIGGFMKGSGINNPNAPEASHMFFSKGITSGFASMFATHPPLKDRITRIEPGWNGQFIAARPQAEGAGAPNSRAEQMRERKQRREKLQQALAASAMAAPTVVNSIGQVSQQHLDAAQALVDALPEALANLAREPYGSRAVIYAMLLDRDEGLRTRQFTALQQAETDDVVALTKRIAGELAYLDARLRLPLIDLALPALRSFSLPQYARFRGNVQNLIAADNQLNLFEWCLQRIVLHALDRHFQPPRKRRASHSALGRLGEPLSALLSTLAYVGHGDDGDAQRALDEAAGHISGVHIALRPKSQCGLDVMNDALDILQHCAPRPMRQIVHACAACIQADRTITPNEAEVFRAIGNVLGCPVPPMLAGQTLI
jgi:Zn-dependent protease with chaperone function